MNISPKLLADATRVAIPISFDGQLNVNAQIQLENIQITDRACSSSRSLAVLQAPLTTALSSLGPRKSNANRLFPTPVYPC